MGIDLDMDSIPDTGTYAPLPDGEYAAIVESCEERAGSKGSYFSVTYRVLSGQQGGRKIFDSLFFTPAAIPRAKLVLGRLGFVTTGKLHLDAEQLVGRRAIVAVVTEEYVDESGVGKKRNKVPFEGVRKYDEREASYLSAQVPVGVPADTAQATLDDSEDDAPF